MEQGDQARRDLKQELKEANDKTIALEEELFESKTLQNELLEELKDAEERLHKTLAEC